MQRTSTAFLVLALVLGACGGDDPKPETGTPDTPTRAAAISGEAWDGDSVDPTVASDQIRALAFFKPT